MKSNDKIQIEISLPKSKQEKQHTGDHNKNMEKSAIQRIKYINPYISNTNFWLKTLDFLYTRHHFRVQNYHFECV